MGQNTPPDDDKDLSRLKAEDQKAWDEFASEFVPQHSAEKENFKDLLDGHVDEVQEEIIESAEDASAEIEIPLVPRNKVKKNQSSQLDRRTSDKLRKGKMPIEARLDLHGMSREVAHDAVTNFIISSQERGLRTVIIITGKGKSKSTSDDWLVKGKGVLKENVPYWLEGIELRPYVLKFMSAQPKDGGTGALYVYLKRQR